jgi:hypothetical protein
MLYENKGAEQFERGLDSRLGFGGGLGNVRENFKENVEMSSSSESVHWLDRWWGLFVILYGVLFVSILVSFSPTI